MLLGAIIPISSHKDRDDLSGLPVYKCCTFLTKPSWWRENHCTPSVHGALGISGRIFVTTSAFSLLSERKPSAVCGSRAEWRSCHLLIHHLHGIEYLRQVLSPANKEVTLFGLQSSKDPVSRGVVCLNFLPALAELAIVRWNRSKLVLAAFSVSLAVHCASARRIKEIHFFVTATPWRFSFSLPPPPCWATSSPLPSRR